MGTCMNKRPGGQRHGKLSGGAMETSGACSGPDGTSNAALVFSAALEDIRLQETTETFPWIHHRLHEQACKDQYEDRRRRT